MEKNRAKFTIGAFGIIFDEQNRVLLCHRTDYDLWNLPGGQVEAGESPWDGVIREVKEESGFDVEVLKIFTISSRREKDDITFTFLCKTVGGQITLNKEADKIEYFEIDKIPKNTVISQVKRIKSAIENPSEVLLEIRTGKSSIELVKEGKL